MCVCHSDFYENAAVMLEEEGAVIVGLLVGLNVIDANLCVKGEDLDSQVSLTVPAQTLTMLNYNASAELYILYGALYCKPNEEYHTVGIANTL